MLQTLKVLRAAAALHEFTVDEVARYASVPQATVRTVLRRHKDWFPEIGSESTGRRGGQWTIYRASSEAARNVAHLIEEHREATSETLGRPPGLPEPPTIEERLGAVEHVLLAPPDPDEQDWTRRIDLARTAVESLRAEIESYVDNRLALRYAAAELLARTIRSDWTDDADIQGVTEAEQQWEDILIGLGEAGLGGLAQQIVDRLGHSPAGRVLTIAAPETSRTRPVLIIDAIPGDPDQVTSAVVRALRDLQLGTRTERWDPDRRHVYPSLETAPVIARPTWRSACVVTAEPEITAEPERLARLFDSIASTPSLSVIMAVSHHDPALARAAYGHTWTYIPIDGLDHDDVRSALRAHLRPILGEIWAKPEDEARSARQGLAHAQPAGAVATEREIIELRNVASREAEEKRAAASKLLTKAKEKREVELQALELELAERSERSEREESERHEAAVAATQKLVAEAEQRAKAAAARAKEIDRTADQRRQESEAQSGEIIEKAKSFAERAIADAKSEADQLVFDAKTHAEVTKQTAEREVAELARQRDAVTNQLTQLREMLSGLAGLDALPGEQRAAVEQRVQKATDDFDIGEPISQDPLEVPAPWRWPEPVKEPPVQERADVLVIVGVYNSSEAADADYGAVKALHGAGAGGIYDAAVITKDESGKVHVRHEKPTQHGPLSGPVIGALVGMLFSQPDPRLVPGGAVGAAAAGALMGYFWRRMSRGDMRELGEVLDEGEASLMVVSQSKLEEAIKRELKRAARTYEKQIDGDARALRTELDRTIDAL